MLVPALRNEKNEENYNITKATEIRLQGLLTSNKIWTEWNNEKLK